MLAEGAELDCGRRARARNRLPLRRELKKLLTELGVTNFKGCGCNDKAAQMNRWGVDGCRENFDTIRGWITEAQAATGWATTISVALKAAVSGLAINPTEIAGILVRIAIERAK